MDIFQLTKEINSDITSCKGVFFRANVSKYWDSDKGVIGERRTVRILKRKSCPGCSACAWIYDHLQEDVENVHIEDVENGKVYSIIVTNEHTDWETGIVDDYDLSFKEVKEMT